MSDILKHCYPTIDSVKEWQRKVENYSGFECQNIRDLKPNSTLDDFHKAKEADALWFEGFINDLQNLL